MLSGQAAIEVICFFLFHTLVSFRYLQKVPANIYDIAKEYALYNSCIHYRNIAKGTTDPRVEFCLPKYLVQVISQDERQILIKFDLRNLDQALKHQHLD